MYRRYFKRALDLAISLCALVVLSPLILFVAVLLAIANRGNPFFVQVRPGRGEKLFRIVKFKTMNDRRDSDGKLLSDKERLTTVGRFVRKTSCDELPQLINVLAGQMSLIGPRPLLPQYLPLYSPAQRRRHEVRPGITGWAQVNGRNAISWERKFELDQWYVDNITFRTDMKILLLSVRKVLKSEGIAKEAKATTDAFTGNN